MCLCGRFFTDYSGQADKKVFFTKYQSQADLTIYYGTTPPHGGRQRDTPTDGCVALSSDMRALIGLSCMRVCAVCAVDYEGQAGWQRNSRSYLLQ